MLFQLVAKILVKNFVGSETKTDKFLKNVFIFLLEFQNPKKKNQEIYFKNIFCERLISESRDSNRLIALREMPRNPMEENDGKREN